MSSSKGPIALLVPRLPPSICGIGGYTSQLLKHLADSDSIILFVRDGCSASKLSFSQSDVQEVPSHQADFLNLLNLKCVSCLIVQYSGYGFNSRGAPLALLRAIRAWRSQHRSAKLILMAHELWHTPPWWKPNAVMQFFHRRELCALAQCADQVFTSTEGYAFWLTPFVDQCKLKCLPIGSNITPIVPPETSCRIPGLWVLFGKQGSRLNSLRAFAPTLSILHKRGLLQRLVVIGSNDSFDLDQQEARLLQQFLPSQSYEQTGTMPDEQISQTLLQSEYGVLGQSCESFTKSTILMAYASHGVIPVVASDAPRKPSYAWLQAVDHLLVMNSTAERLASIREDLLAWYQQNGDWNHISLAYSEAINK